MPNKAEKRKTFSIPIFVNKNTDISTADAKLWWLKLILYHDLIQNLAINLKMKESATVITEPETKLRKHLLSGNVEKAIQTMTTKVQMEPVTEMTARKLIDRLKARKYKLLRPSIILMKKLLLTFGTVLAHGKKVRFPSCYC